MSYEGYVQTICENGHYDTFDCYMEEEKCTVCGAKWAHRHDVDQTNDNGESREVIETVPAVMYPLKEKLVALVNPMLSSDEVIKLFNEILESCHPKQLEEAKYKFGKVIKRDPNTHGEDR